MKFNEYGYPIEEAKPKTQLTDVQIFARILAAIPGSDVVAAVNRSGLALTCGPIKLGEMIDRHCQASQEQYRHRFQW